MSSIFNRILIFFVAISCFLAIYSVAVSSDETEIDIIHKMQKGETLWRVSISNYGTPRYAYLIAEYNNIKNVRRIQINQEIKIPKVFLYEIKS
ncbi:MAG: LysM peptidoglycan-binding domain-containing protein, partial [Candidatus Poribacteria bacterium]